LGEINQLFPPKLPALVLNLGS